MDFPPIARIELVLRLAVVTLLTGCGIVTGTNAPQPVDSNPSSTSTVAPSGLQLGYLWQPDSHNLYPIMGITGSVHYGTGILQANPDVVTAAAASSTSGSWALLLNKDGTVQELQLPSLTAMTLTGGVAVDSAILFSPSGTSAALLSGSTRTVVIVNGLPTKPQIVSIQLAAGSVPVGAAMSDAGTALVGIKHGTSPAVQLATVSELHGPTPIGTIQGWGGAGFVPASAAGSATEAVVVADSLAARITYITNLNGTSPMTASIPTSGTLQTPAGVGVSLDGKWAFIADSGKSQVVRLNLVASGPSPIAIPCACKLQEVSPLTTNGIFSVGGRAVGQPAWILDTRTNTPRTFFVPAMEATAASQAAATALNEPASGASR